MKNNGYPIWHNERTLDDERDKSIKAFYFIATFFYGLILGRNTGLMPSELTSGWTARCTANVPGPSAVRLRWNAE